MAKSDPTKDKKAAQIRKFRETAHQLGTDESEAAFDTALKRVAKSPQPVKRSKSPTKGHKVERPR